MQTYMARDTESDSVLGYVPKIGIWSPLFDVVGDDVLCRCAYLAGVAVSFKDGTSPQIVSSSRAVHVGATPSEPIGVGLPSQSGGHQVFPVFGLRAGSATTAHPGLSLFAERLPGLGDGLCLSRTGRRAKAPSPRTNKVSAAHLAFLGDALPLPALEAGVSRPTHRTPAFLPSQPHTLGATAGRVACNRFRQHGPLATAESAADRRHCRHKGAPSEGQVLLRRRHQNGPREGMKRHLTSYRCVSVAPELYQIRTFHS